MASGDEPQLGGQDHDNTHGDLSPMISGRGTKIIASARGAYLAGNLRALLDHMDADQTQRYQCLLAEARIRICEGLDPHLRQYRERAQRVVNAAHLWLDDPTVAQGWRLIIALVESGDLFFEEHSQRFSFSPQFFVEDREVAPLLEPFEALIELMVSSPERYANNLLLNFAQYRWQLEIAWSILNGRVVPTYDAFITDGLQGEYRSGDLHRLIRRMNQGQSQRFQTFLMHQLLSYLLSLEIGKLMMAHAHNLLEALRQWIDQPSAEQVAVVEAQIKVVRQIARHHASTPIARLHDVCHCAETIIRWAPATSAEVVTRHFEQFGWSPRLGDLRWGQVEAAWAILHDQPVPTLGDRMIGGDHNDGR